MTCVTHCYAVLAIVSNSYPPLWGRLPTRYSPVRNSLDRCKHQSSAFYLHVLGTPPAFVLSQDQTLIKMCLNLLVLSVADRFISRFWRVICLHITLTFGSSYSVLKGLVLFRDNYFILSTFTNFVNNFFTLFFEYFSRQRLLSRQLY